jgi:hypothetical protein
MSLFSLFSWFCIKFVKICCISYTRIMIFLRTLPRLVYLRFNKTTLTIYQNYIQSYKPITIINFLLIFNFIHL